MSNEIMVPINAYFVDLMKCNFLGELPKKIAETDGKMYRAKNWLGGRAVTVRKQMFLATFGSGKFNKWKSWNAMSF